MAQEMFVSDLPLSQQDVYAPDTPDRPSDWQAMFETESSLGSLEAMTEDMPLNFDVVDRGFDAHAAAQELGDLVSDQAKYDLLGARNAEEFQWKYKNIQREKLNREVIAEMSLTNSLSLGLAAAILDPVSWAMAPLPLLKGASFASRALKAAPIGMADLAISEVALHATQTERTLEESIYNVGAGALFAGVLGGAFGRESTQMALSRISKDATAADGSGIWYMKTYTNPEDATTGSGSAGAAKTRRYVKLVDEDYQNEMYDLLEAGEIDDFEFMGRIATKAQAEYQTVAGKAFKAIRQILPTVDTSFAKNWRVSALMDTMANSSLLKSFHVDGKSLGHALDIKTEVMSGQLMAGRLGVMEEYYGKAIGDVGIAGKIGIEAAGVFGKNEKLTLAEFNREIVRAFDNRGKHDNPIIEEAAAKLRDMDEAFEEMLVEAKVLAPGNYAEVQALKKRRDELDVEEKALFAAIDAETARIDKATVERGRLKDELKYAQRTQQSKEEIAKLTKRIDTQNRKLNSSKRKIKTREQKAEKNKIDIEDNTNSLNDMRYDKTHGDPIGGGWYVPRIFKTMVAFDNQALFIRRTTDDLIEQMREAAEEGALKGADLEKAKADYAKAMEDGGRKVIESDMMDVWTKITKSQTGHQGVQLGGASRFKAQRKLSVRNEALRGKADGDIDFLESEYMALKKAHIRSMTQELVEKQNGFDFDVELGEVNKEWNRLIRQAGLDTSEGKALLRNRDEMNPLEFESRILELGENSKEGKAVKTEQKRLNKKLRETHDLMNNRLGHPNNPFGPMNRMRSAIMNWNVMRALGSMTISALPDLGNIVTRIGMAPVARHLASIATQPSRRKMGRAATKKLILVFERVEASRMNQLTMTGNLSPGMGVADKMLHNSAKHFITATGMNHWNQGLKEFVITAYTDEIMRTAIKVANNPDYLSKLKRAKFAEAGIDNEMWEGIAKLHRKYGEPEGGLEIPNIDRWNETPEEEALAYRLMMTLKKEADTAIVTPGAGDLPLWMRSHVGGMLGQFKSFSFAATGKIFLPSIQRMSMGDPNAFAGLATQMALGSAVYGLKMHLMGKEVNTDPNVLFREAIDRSGYFGIFTDANAMLEKVTRGNLGIAGIYKQFGIESPELSRYYTRPVLGDILGPSTGTIEDVNKMLGSIFKGEVTPGDISAWRRMIPYQNMFYLRNMFNDAQNAANERFVE